MIFTIGARTNARHATRWNSYAVPLRAAREEFTDTQLILLGASPRIAFTAVSFAMRKVSNGYFPRCLAISATLSSFGLISFAQLPSNFVAGFFVIMITSGIATAIANISSTAFAFSYVDQSKFGLVSCLDILSPRLGGAFYLHQFDWSSRSLGIVVSSTPLILLLWRVSVSQRFMRR